MKKFTALLAMLVVLVALSACGGSDDGVMKINFWHAFNGPNEAAITELTQQFNEKHKGEFQVVLTGQGNYDNLQTAATAAIKANKAPDLVATYPDHVAEYMQSGSVVELDDYIFDSEVGMDYDFTYQKYTLQEDGSYATEDVTANYFEDIMPIFREESNGYATEKYLSLPLNKSTEVLYYNKTYFEEKGYEVPETWDDVKVLAEAIKADTVGTTKTITIGKTEKTLSFPDGQYALGYDSLANLAISLFHQSGGGYTEYKTDGTVDYIFDNQTNIEAINMYKDLVDNGLATIPELVDPSLRYMSDLFVNQAVYMNIGSTGGSNYQNPQGKFEVGVAKLPQMADENGDLINPSVIQQGTNITMLNQNGQEERDAAWKYIKFITSPEASAYFASHTAYLPIRQSSFDSQQYQEYLNTKDEFAADPNAVQIGGLTERVAFSQVDWFFVDPAAPGSSAARVQMEEEMGNILKANKDIAQALEDAYNNLTQ